MFAAMEVAGYILAGMVGIVMGLTGAGGSILTIPLLVYFFKMEPVSAGAYSLFIVGATSIIGAVPKFKQKLIDLRTALVFGLPGLLSVFATRYLLLPLIPEELFSFGSFILYRSTVMMLAFAALMLAASGSVIRKSKKRSAAEAETGISKLMFQGVSVGLVTGLLGAGGGFLIVPALVLISKLPIKVAAGTSLLIVAANAMAGFWVVC